MTLQVPFDQFSATVQRVLGTKEVFVTASGSGCLVTAATGEKGFIVAARTDLALEAAKKKLKHDGMEVSEGTWSLTVDTASSNEARPEPFFAAVAYKSGESMPGVWLDAGLTLPTQVQVLRGMYEEFRETGELPDVSFEEFVRLAEPNVVIVTPNEVQSFIQKKADNI